MVTLFVTIDPIGLAPVFLALTAGQSRAERRRVAIRASLIAAGILIGASLVGEWLLEALGISLDAFRIAGGLLLFIIAFEMLFNRRQQRKVEQIDASDEAAHVAAFPLAIPLMAGPGAISATILVAAGATEAMRLVWLEVIIVVIIGLSFLAFLSAEWIERALTRTGRIVLTRLLGLILGALSVQFVVDGIRSIVASS
ncbi:MAG: MarC family protein [Bauldia sp.]|nr:MarC family protein [Bauldia sp.]